MTSEDKQKVEQTDERQQTMDRLSASIGTPNEWVKQLSHLQFKEQFILLSYFGLNEFEQLSMEQIAKIVGMSVVTTRVYFNRACAKISILQHEQNNAKYKHLFLYTNSVLTPDNYIELLNLPKKDKMNILYTNSIKNAEEGLEILKTNPRIFTDNLKFFSVNERYFLSHLFGLNGVEKLTPEQIIANLNISQCFFSSLKLSCTKKLMQIERLLNENGSTEAFVGQVYAVDADDRRGITITNKRRLSNNENAFWTKLDYYAQHPEFVTKNLTHLSIGEQYTLLRTLGLNGFEKISGEQIAEDLKILEQSYSSYLWMGVKKLSILEEAVADSAELKKVQRHKSPVLTIDNYTEYIGLSAVDKYAVGVGREKRAESLGFEEEKKRCAKFRQIAYEEDAEFINLFDQIYAGKEYKLPSLLGMIEKKKKLTNNQQNYLFSLYNIERFTGKDLANSCVLALLIMGNKNIVNHILNTKYATFNSYYQEKIEMELQDALRRAIDGYSLESGTTFSTYAFKVLQNARVLNDKQIVPLSLDTTTIDDDDSVYMYSTLGEEDEFIEDYAEREIRQDLWKLVGYLKPQNQFIIMAYYGKYRQPMVLTEIGQAMGITKSRASQRLGKSLNLIRQFVSEPQSIAKKSPQQQSEWRLLTEDEFNSILSTSAGYNY